MQEKIQSSTCKVSDLPTERPVCSTVCGSWVLGHSAALQSGVKDFSSSNKDVINSYLNANFHYGLLYSQQSLSAWQGGVEGHRQGTRERQGGYILVIFTFIFKHLAAALIQINLQIRNKSSKKFSQTSL